MAGGVKMPTPHERHSYGKAPATWVVLTVSSPTKTKTNSSCTAFIAGKVDAFRNVDVVLHRHQVDPRFVLPSHSHGNAYQDNPMGTNTAHKQPRTERTTRNTTR